MSVDYLIGDTLDRLKELPAGPLLAAMDPHNDKRTTQ